MIKTAEKEKLITMAYEGYTALGIAFQGGISAASIQQRILKTGLSFKQIRKLRTEGKNLEQVMALTNIYSPKKKQTFNRMTSVERRLAAIEARLGIREAA